MLTLSVQNAAGAVLASASGQEETWLVYEPEYVPGDVLSVSCGEGAWTVFDPAAG